MLTAIAWVVVIGCILVGAANMIGTDDDEGMGCMVFLFGIVCLCVYLIL
jgi:hypothetical protein